MNLEREATLFSQKRIQSINNLPVDHKSRRITDVCCCGLGVIFRIIMFILACILFNKNNILRANFPSDNDAHLCLLDKNGQGKQFPFLYFSDLSDPLHSRYCVADCPQFGVQTECWNGPCNLGEYKNYPSSDRLGAYCMPDNQGARNKLISETGINLFNDSVKSIDILLSSLGISVGLSLLWFIFTQFFPKLAVWSGLILSIVLLIITAIVFFVDSKGSLLKSQGWGNVVAVFALIVTVVLIFYLIIHHSRIKYCVAFLQNASLMIKQRLTILLYIPLFISLTFLLGILIVFQYLAFSSSSQPTFSKDSLYSSLSKNFWFVFPLVIQTLWGLSFLRDAFNFCISGCAIQWYFKQEFDCFYPLKIFFTKHFGSIAGGSFINIFFYIPNMFINLCCNNTDSLCCNLFDLPREDSYPYVYMTSTSYCPSVRQVQYLCKRSRICRGNESTNYYFSLASRLVLSLSTMLISYWIMEGRLTGAVVNPFVLLGCFLIPLLITCYFVDVHVNSSQALTIAFLAEFELDQNSYLQMNLARDSLKRIIQDIDEQFEGKVKEFNH